MCCKESLPPAIATCQASEHEADAGGDAYHAMVCHCKSIIVLIEHTAQVTRWLIKGVLVTEDKTLHHVVRHVPESPAGPCQVDMTSW